MTDDPESIEIATKHLQKGIEKLLRKAATKKPHLDVSRAEKQALRLVRHIHHLLVQLLQRRQSLKALIEWLRKEWKSRLKPKLSADHPQQTQEILAHTVQYLVRCQDGLMLLTSGECRHPVDIQEATTTKFPSRLRTLNERADGYTKLYSGEAYSGYGWDEYSNETVGIQARLIEILRPFHKSPWEYLESSSQLLESLLDRQEDVVKMLKQALLEIKEDMSADITKQLAKPIIFSTQDKMERLHVLIPARGGRKEQRISISRLANNFRILGSSVLPNDFQTVHLWDRHLSLNLPKVGKDEDRAAAVSKRRRMVVLEDSDSSGDDVREQLQTKRRNTDVNHTSTTEGAITTGLTVRVETIQAKSETEVSLRSIKEQMGVDIRGLEASRQDLELECQENLDGTSTIYEEELVKRLTRTLTRVEQRAGVDYEANEVWDAREELRQACMELGIWALESSKRGNLEQALSSFEQAKKLTVELQKTHEREVAKSNDQTERARLISRRLLFLLSEASTNIGITLMETAECQPSTSKKHLGKAVREFRQTRELLAQLRGQLDAELGSCSAHSAKWIALKSDSLEGDILDSMVCRFLGKSIWLNGQGDALSSAEKLFEEGWSLFRGFNIACRIQLMPILLGTVEACIESCSTLASLGCTDLENMLQNGVDEEKGSCILRMISKAITKQTEILRDVESLRRTSDPPIQELIKNFEREHSFPSSSASQQSLDEIKTWWRKSRDAPNTLEHQKSKETLPRADISGLGTLKQSAPSGNLPFQGDYQRKNRARNAVAGGRMKYGNPTVRSEEPTTDAGGTWNPSAPYTRPIKFRKWGDELIQISTSTKGEHGVGGEQAPLQFPYPTSPPPIPAELLLLYDPDTHRKRHKAP